MAKFKFVKWLIHFLEVNLYFNFEWDEANSKKSEAKHGVSIYQIETSFYDEDLMPLGVQVSPEVHEERFGILAKSFDQVVIFTCFTVRKNKVRVISSRKANKKEKALYEKEGR